MTVLDNASSDGSAEMVAREFAQVELVRSEENLGFGRANNVLALRSSADYLLLLNSDVIVSADIITPLLEALNEDAGTIVAGPRLVSPSGRVQYSANRLPTLRYEFARALSVGRLGRFLTKVFDSRAVLRDYHQVEATDRREAREAEFLWATCWLLRRSDVGAGGVFDPSFPMYDEDVDFCRRAREQKRTLRYVPEVELVHIGGASSASIARRNRLLDAGRRHYYRVHQGWWAAGIYATLVPAAARLATLIQAIPFSRRRGRPPTGA